MDPKPIVISKTVWLNVIAALAAVLALPEIQAIAGPDAVEYLIVGQSLANIALRILTTQQVRLSLK